MTKNEAADLRAEDFQDRWWFQMGGSKNRIPQNGWFIMENPIKWMIWGYPYFGNTQIVFIFNPIWRRLFFWLIFFRWVETTNQFSFFFPVTCVNLSLESRMRGWERGHTTRVMVWRHLQDKLCVLLKESNDGWTAEWFYTRKRWHGTWKCTLGNSFTFCLFKDV